MSLVCKMAIDPDKLTGKELASYLEIHREDFNGNGDAFCVAAGYGVKGEDGTQKCNFTDFVKALSAAVEIPEECE